MKPICYSLALPSDVASGIVIRGQTRENAISEATLNELGITHRVPWIFSVF